VIYDIYNHKKCLVPIFEMHGSMSKQGEIHLNDMMVLAFSSPVLLMGVGT
jgi:hypothetical protein